ncbi:MAG: hypothetical protein V7760_07525 [Marinobacter sp.]
MAPTEEQISITSEDLQVLDRAGIDKDDMAQIIHEFARNIRRERFQSFSRPSGLTASEIHILRQGGASGLPTDEVAIDQAMGHLSLAQLRTELAQLHQASLSTKEVANLLGITPSRVRQRSGRSNRGLYSYDGPADERRYPIWQFDDCDVIPHLRQVLAALSDGTHPVAVSRFMITDSSDLEATDLDLHLAPRDWLIAGYWPEPVVALIRDI